MTITRVLRLPAAILLALMCTQPACAQRQGAEDCAVPGGCGDAGKPGGAERAPDAGGAGGSSTVPKSRSAPSREPAARADGLKMPNIGGVLRESGRGSPGGRGGEATK